MTKIDSRKRSGKLRGMTLGFCLLVASGAALAGAPGTGHHRGPDADRMLAHMTAELNLSAEQQESVGQALKSRADEMASVREQMRATHREMRRLDPDDPNYSTMVNALAQRQGDLTARMAVLRGEIHADIAGVLDEEQQAKLAEMQERRGERMHERRQKMRNYHDGHHGDGHRDRQRSGAGEPAADSRGS